MGPDGIHLTILRELLGVLTGPLTDLFTQSLLKGEVPEDWQTANFVPLYRKEG